jgi:hypothetical protein
MCPFKSLAGGSSQHEVGRSTSPREMCTHGCALYDDKEQACAFRIIASKLAQSVSVVVQGVDTGALEKRLL